MNYVEQKIGEVPKPDYEKLINRIFDNFSLPESQYHYYSVVITNTEEPIIAWKYNYFNKAVLAFTDFHNEFTAKKMQERLVEKGFLNGGVDNMPKALGSIKYLFIYHSYSEDNV